SEMANIEEFDEFVGKVDKISKIIKDLNSSEDGIQENAIKEANRHIAASDGRWRTKVSGTRINTSPPPLASQTLQTDSPENFMKAMKDDAEFRREKRLEKEKTATALKAQGNEAYAKEDFETAVKYYTEGLSVLQDMQPLYTNRAQAFIKLGKYQEAISDCEGALKCNEGCIKAHLHMGKAYLALKKYNESRKCFETILHLKPGQKNIVKEYLNQVDLQEERDNQELSARQELARGAAEARSIPLLLKKLSVPGQVPYYYCGGFAILSEAVGNCTSQTLFRLNNGFSIISSNDMVRRCLLPETKDPESRELCASVLKLWKVTCRGNAENLKILMECPISKQSIVELLTSEDAVVQQACLALLHVYSEMPYGRRLALDNLNVPILTKNLMYFTNLSPSEMGSAEKLFSSIHCKTRFCIQVRDVLTGAVVVPFTSILRNVSAFNQQTLPPLVSAVGRLARDNVNRCSVAHDPDCWTAFVDAISRCRACDYKDVLYALLGLIINLSTVTSPAIQKHAAALCVCCMDLLKDSNGDIVTRAAGVLSAVLPQSSEAVQHALQQNIVRVMHQLLKRDEPMTTKYAIQTLAACTAASRLAREELLKSDKKLSDLRHLLGSSCDETVSGNAALCCAHCLELEGISSRLLGTDIVPVLLRHAAADAANTDVQKNAAIALGKLCRSEPRHMDKLREMHGLEILHSCMKLIACS
uniref:Tetratricopeptide repeat domain 12 n=1 Tax=Tetraodon nigroviridis TaxID=99883 RepID=H3C3R3_TETNG